MPADIHRQRYGKTGPLRHFLQLAVDKVQGILVLPPFRDGRISYHRQQVFRGHIGMPLHDLLHAGLPLHMQSLSGLLPAIGQEAILQVGLLKVGLIFLHQTGVDLIGRYIMAFPKSYEAVQCCCVGFRCACLAQLFQTGDNLSHETEISNRTYYLPEGVERAVTKVEDRRREARYKGQAI